MAKCNNCGKFVEEFLHRVNPKGEKGVWWCESCIRKLEPELWKNIEKEISEVEKELLQQVQKWNDKLNKWKKDNPGKPPIKITYSEYIAPSETSEEVYRWHINNNLDEKDN